MKAAAAVVRRMLKRNGTVDGLPRMLNHETGEMFLGYTQINQQATTPFSRTKTHKGYFVGDAKIANGDLLEDLVENMKYLVMSVKSEYTGGHVAYYDSTLYWANTTCHVYRVDDSVVNEFGRNVQGWQTVYSDVPVMVNPLHLDAQESEEVMVDISKIKIVIQSKYDVRKGDRITGANGNVYVVRSIDKDSLANLFTLHVEMDVR